MRDVRGTKRRKNVPVHFSIAFYPLSVFSSRARNARIVHASARVKPKGRKAENEIHAPICVYIYIYAHAHEFPYIYMYRDVHGSRQFFLV